MSKEHALTNPRGNGYVSNSGFRPSEKDLTPDYGNECIVCGATPIVPCSEMCGPCTFGEADTIGGNW